MEGKVQEYMTVWGDTVKFRQLLLGLLGGALMGYFSFTGGSAYLKAYHPGLGTSLLSGYALLFGVGGSVLAGIIAGFVFSPNRVFHEEDFQIDKQLVLKELGLDPGKEAEYLKTVPAEVIAEMKKLQLYDVFADEPKAKGVAE
jgi:hypothetical protein